MSGGLTGLVLRVLAALLVCELTARALVLLPPVAERIARAHQYDTGAELLWYGGWVGSQACDHRPPAVDEVWTDALHDPDLGWVPAPGRHDVDARGMRAEGLARASDARRVVIVGDSFAYGSDVDITETFAYALESRRPDLDILNLAVYGYGLDQIVLRTERDAAALDPDVVVLVALGLDLPRMASDFYPYAKPWLAQGPEGFVIRGQPVPTPLETVARIGLRSRVVDLLRIYVERRRWKPLLSDDLPQELVLGGRHLLDRWEAAVREAGATPVLVVLPVPHELEELLHTRRSTRIETVRALFADWCAGRDLVCRDAFDEVAAQVTDVASFRTMGHWSPSAHRLVADAIEAALADAGLGPT